MREVIQEAITILEKTDPMVVATVVRTKGSTPQKPGSKLLVRSDGTGVGTLGGGCVEGDIWFAASELLKNNRDYSICANTSVAVLKHDAPEMVCMGFPTVVRIHPACIRSIRLRGQLLEESG